MKYKVNPLAVMFHEDLDLRNKYQTLIYSGSGELIVTTKQEYFILKIVNQNPGIRSSQIEQIINDQVYPFINRLRKEEIEQLLTKLFSLNVLINYE